MAHSKKKKKTKVPFSIEKKLKKSPSPSKVSIFSRRKFGKLAVNNFLKKYSTKRLLNSQKRQASPSVKIRSLRKDDRLSKLLEKEMKNRRSVRDIRRNFSVKDQQSGGTPFQESHLKLYGKYRSQRVPSSSVRKPKNMAYRQNTYYQTCNFHTNGPKSKKKTNTKRKKHPKNRSLGIKNISQRKLTQPVRPNSSKRSDLQNKLGVPGNLRKNFSNFQSCHTGSSKINGFMSQKNTLKETRDKQMRTQKSLKNFRQSRSNSRPVTWVPGLTSKHFPRKATLRSIQSKDVNHSRKMMNFNPTNLCITKKYSSGAFPNHIGYRNKAVTYNSMHINKTTTDPLDMMQVTEIIGDKNSFLAQSVFKESSLIGEPLQRNPSKPLVGRFQEGSQRNPVLYLPQKGPAINPHSKTNYKGFKSKPMIKDLVAQLKDNHSLKIELFRSLGYKIPISKKRKSLNPKKNLIKVISYKKPTSNYIMTKSKRGSSRLKLEKLKTLNRLIINDKLQVSKLKNELEKSSQKMINDKSVYSKFKLNQKMLEFPVNLSHLKKQKSKALPISNYFPSKVVVPIPITGGNVNPKTSMFPEAFSLPNNKVIPYKLQSNHKLKDAFQYNKYKSKSKSKVRKNSKTINRKEHKASFSKKTPSNTIYLVAGKQKSQLLLSSLHSKENKACKSKTSKKSKRFNNSNVKRSQRARASSSKQALKIIPKSPPKKRVLRDQDIQHHMNLILANDLAVDRRKIKKKSRKESVRLKREKRNK